MKVLLILCITIIFIFLILLFYPVSYLLEGKWQDEKWVRVQSHWLFHIFRIRISYEDSLIYGEMYVFWKKKTFFQDFTSEELEEDAQETGEHITDTIKDIAEDIADIGATEESKCENDSKNTSSETEDNNSSSEKAKKNTRSENPDKKKKSIISKIKDMIKGIRKIYPRIKKILTDKQHKEAFSHLKKEFSYLIRILLPKKSKVNVVFSTGSPDTTGQLFGILACFPVIYQKDWSVSPDFQEEKPYVKGEFWGKGKIALYQPVFIVLRILFDKNCRRLYHHIRKFINWTKKETKSWEEK